MSQNTVILVPVGGEYPNGFPFKIVRQESEDDRLEQFLRVLSNQGIMIYEVDDRLTRLIKDYSDIWELDIFRLVGVEGAPQTEDFHANLSNHPELPISHIEKMLADSSHVKSASNDIMFTEQDLFKAMTTVEDKGDFEDSDDTEE